jgi:formate dehydrogenase subunit delta
MKQGMYEILISAPAPTKTIEQLLNNLNDIGKFYEAYPEEEAVQEIVTHIQDYMAPSIRRQIVAHLKHGGVGMKAIVQLAVGRLKEVA